MGWLHDVQTQGRSGEELVENLLYYISSRGEIDDPATFEHLVCEQLPEMGAKMSTVFGQLEQRGLEKGLEQGLERGEAIGTEKARQQMAQRLLARGTLPLDDISDLTDLSIEIIHKLQKSRKATDPVT